MYLRYLLAGAVLVLVGSLVWASCERNRADYLEGLMDARAEGIRQLESQNEALRETLQRTTAESSRIISEAQTRIDQLRTDVDASRARERVFESRLVDLQARSAERIGAVASETDVALSRSVEDMLGVSVVATSGGFILNRSGLEAVKVSLLRHEATREELEARVGQLQEKDLQVARLEEAIRQQDVKFDALSNRLKVAEDRLDVQDRLILEKDEYIRLILEQNRSLRRQVWLQRAATAGAVTIAVAAAVF